MIRTTREEGTATITTQALSITGMHCSSCGKLIDEALEEVPGVASSITNVGQSRTDIDFDPSIISLDAIYRTLGELATLARRPRRRRGPFGAEDDAGGSHMSIRSGPKAVAAGLVGAGLGAAALKAALGRHTARLASAILWSSPSGGTVEAALAARTLGDGVPVTVLLHGLFASGRYWGAAFDELGAQALLVVPDLAGFGRSLHVASGFGPDDHADIVAQTLREIGVVGPTVVGAHSLGCLVALRLAARHPELVAAIVGFSPPLYASRDDAIAKLGRASALLRLFVVHPGVAEAVCDWMCDHPPSAARLGRWLRPDLPLPLAEDRLRHTYRSYSQTLAKVIVAAGAGAWLDEVSVPVHLVAGDADTILDRAFLGELEQRHPNISVSTWTGARHEIPLTHPGACVAELERMTAQLQAVGLLEPSQRADGGPESLSSARAACFPGVPTMPPAGAVPAPDM